MNILRAGVIVLFVLVLAALARTYVGHSPGPYGVCYAASGRAIPCALAKR